MMRLCLVLVSLLFATTACSVLGGDDEAVDLADREFWATEVVENGTPRALVEGTRIVLRFQAADLGASAGCNSLGGSYSLDGDRLVVGDLFMTEMGCDPARHAQDDFVVGFLASNPQVTLDGTDLELTADSVVMRLVDADVANPDRPIVGTRWEVDGFDDGQAATSFAIERPATFAFVDQSTIEGFDGCGEFAGSVEVGEAEIQVGSIEWSALECEPLEYVRNVRKVLDGRASFTIDGTRLRIEHETGLSITARTSD